MSNGEERRKKGGRKEEEYEKSKIQKESKIQHLYIKMIALLMFFIHFINYRRSRFCSTKPLDT